MIARIAALTGSLGLLLAPPAGAIVAGQVDDFQSSAFANWISGAMPTNIPTGGPAGTDDRYYRVSATAHNLGAHNNNQWAGDYTAAGVGAIEFDLNNFGPDPVELRIMLSSPTGVFATANETVLPASSGWVKVNFGLSAADLVLVAGTGTLAQALATVSNVLIRHDPDPASPPGQPNLVTAVLGIDNVKALPEPSGVLLLGAGALALAALRHARGLGNIPA